MQSWTWLVYFICEWWDDVQGCVWHWMCSCGCCDHILEVASLTRHFRHHIESIINIRPQYITTRQSSQMSTSIQTFWLNRHWTRYQLLVSCSVVCVRQVKLVSDISQLYDDSYAVFRKYQMTIHNDTPSDCTQSDFSNFLVDTPLRSVCCICCNVRGSPCGTVCTPCTFFI